MRILFCASEVSPYAKTGGLADVAGSLPEVLRRLRCDVRVFMPFYRCVREQANDYRLLPYRAKLTIGIHEYTVRFRECVTPSGVPLYFLEKDEFFDRTWLYGTPALGDYEDNAQRFIAFCLSVHPLCSAMDWYPNVIHLHDWQTGLIAAYQHFFHRNFPEFAATGTVLTIHNLAYQGIFPASHFALTGLPSQAFSIAGMEFWGQCNFLKAGLVFSDYLTTVSPRYSKEIQDAPLGHGLEGVLQERSHVLQGILNGIDTQKWNPQTDPFISENYSSDNLAGKRRCKEALLRDFELPSDDLDIPVLGMISRLAGQKGFDLLLEIIEDLMQLPVFLIILGEGDAGISHKLDELAKRHPNKLKTRFEFNEAFAHRVEAGSDIFLMPSLYEPCGLNQMYSLRYGTIPVVHATGGLDDSVVDIQKDPHQGTGFKFYTYSAKAFFETVKAAIGLYQDKDFWVGIQHRAMAQDFSWHRSASEYLDVYEKVIRMKSSRP